MADTPQFPNLLLGYAVRPAWQVAGVDYYVGVASGTALKDPATISMAGVSVNTSTRTVTISGNGVTLDGYDFSLHGGYQVYVSGANDTISNSNFVLGTNTGARLIYGGSSSSNLTITNNTMDASSGGNQSSLIGFEGTGTITLDHNWFKNFPQHVLELTQFGSTTFSVVYKYNLIQNGGVLPAHLNYLQFGGGHAISVDVEYNTGYQTNSSGGETFQFYNNTPGGSIDYSTLAYNTLIASGGPQGSHMGYMIHGGYNTTYNPSPNPGIAHDNYFDPSASWGSFYNGSFQGWTGYNNVDMVTGKFVDFNNNESGVVTPPIDTTPPLVPTIDLILPDTIPTGDHHTTANKLTISGHGEVASHINLFDNGGLIGGATVNASGSWTFTSNTLPVGTHNFTATDTDAAGNVSPVSAPFAMTVDAAPPPPPPPPPPAGPTVSINDVTISEGNSGTKVATFTVTRSGGTAAFDVNFATSNGTARVADNDYVAASGTLHFGASENTKTISVTINGDTKVEANQTFNVVLSNATNGATISDGQGVGTITNDDGVDTVAPAKPVISGFSTDTGIKGDGITNDHTLSLTGTAEANSTVIVHDGTKLLGTAHANSTGAWSYPTGTLLDATHSFAATATDAAGNVSAASPSLAVTVATPGGHLWKVAAQQDFSSDGSADFLWTDPSTGALALWTAQATTVTGGAALPNPGASWHVVGAGDFNGDNKSDILWQGSDGTPALWLMNGTNIVAMGAAGSFNPGSSWQIKGSGDFNGDGRDDILWQGSDGTPSLWLMDGTHALSVGAAGSFNPGPSWQIKGSGDFNGDGKSDILWQGSDGTPAIWLMDGTHALSVGAAGSFNPGSSWQIKDSGDFNGDGKSDILWQGSDGTPAIWLMDGTKAIWVGAVGPSNPGANWHVEGSGDFNGDAKADILWQDDNGAAAVWTMNGTTVTGIAGPIGDPSSDWHLV